MSERVVRKKQGIKRARSISRMSQDESMEVDTKFQTKRVKPGRDVSGLRDAKQVSLRKPFLWLTPPCGFGVIVSFCSTITSVGIELS